MNAQATELRQERASLIDELQTMLAKAESEQRDLLASEQRTYDAKIKQADSLQARIERSERIGNEAEQLNQPWSTPHRPSVGDCPSQAKSAAERFYRSGDKSGFNNALTIGTDGDGGYTVIPQLDIDLFDSIAEANPIFADAERVVTSSDNWMRVYTVSGAASGRVAESGTRTETASPKYARQEINLSMQYAHPQVSEELLLSSEYDIAGHVSREIQIAFDADFEAEFLDGSGTGVNQKGILTAADSTDADGTRSFSSYQLVSGVSTDSITYGEIVGLLHSLPPRYRRNAKLYASTEVIQAMRLLLDGGGLPIWRETDGAVGRPQSLLGVEVVEVTAMPGFGADAKTLIYGDLAQAYAFVSHQIGVQIQRDPYTSPGMVKYYTRLFCGSGPTDTRALKVFQQAAS